MNKVIDEIAKTTFTKYGKFTIFREYEFKPITVDKVTAFYRVQSAVNYPYIYQIQVHVFDRVLLSTSSIRNKFHKCMYCNQKNANYKMRCCGKDTHLECGVKNKFSCCHLNMYLNQAPQGECCICLESANTVTECGHNLCYSCLDQMYKNTNGANIKLLCPLCRTTILQEEQFTDYKNVTINNNEEVVCISYL